jgi:hypothetical protein
MRYDGITGAFIDAFVAPNSGGLISPYGLRFAPDGNLLVSSSLTQHVKRYNGLTGSYINDFVSTGSGGLFGPAGLIYGPDSNLYVASIDNDRVLRYNGTTGAFIDNFVPNMSGGLWGPTDLIYGADGNLYVASVNTRSILRYNGTTGAFIDAFVPGYSGGLNAPEDLLFGPDGNLYVTSYYTHSVKRYNGITGAYMGDFVAAGSGGLNGPWGLLFGPDGNLYVSSLNTNAVLRYNGTTGAFMDVFVAAGSGGISGPRFLMFRDLPMATITPNPTLTPTRTPAPTNTSTSTTTTTPTSTVTNLPSATVTLAPPTLTATVAAASPTSATTPAPSTTCEPTLSPTRIATPAFTPAPGCSDRPRSGDLRAVITDHPTTTDALFTNTSSVCSYRIGLAIYKKFDNNIDHQVLYDYRLAIIPPNSQMLLTAQNPTCAYQGDAFYGDILYSLANGARYGIRRLDDTDGNGTNYCRDLCPTPPPATSTPTPNALPTQSPTTVPLQCLIKFSDVDPAHPFYAYIQCLACRGILNGYGDGAFRPTHPLTRGQAAKIIANSVGYAETITSTQQTFADVPPSQPFWLWIERVAGHNLVSGYVCGGLDEPCDAHGRAYFRPTHNVTRGQLVKIVANAAGYQDPIPATQQSFTDVPFGDPFWQYIERINGRGIINGYVCGQGPAGPCDDQGRPYFLAYTVVTRGQAAKIVTNTFSPDCEWLNKPPAQP